MEAQISKYVDFRRKISRRVHKSALWGSRTSRNETITAAVLGGFVFLPRDCSLSIQLCSYPPWKPRSQNMWISGAKSAQETKNGLFGDPVPAGMKQPPQQCMEGFYFFHRLQLKHSTMFIYTMEAQISKYVDFRRKIIRSVRKSAFWESSASRHETTIATVHGGFSFLLKTAT